MYLRPENTQGRAQPERRHTNQGGQSIVAIDHEEMPVGKQTYIMHNRKTQKEVEVTQSMGSKKRVGTMFDARNGLAMASLGDKVYKTPVY